MFLVIYFSKNKKLYVIYVWVLGIENMVLMAREEIKNSDQIWFLDSGGNNHMTGERQWFSDLDESYKYSVKVGDNLKMAVVGKGNVRLEIEGVSHIITSVYYNPELKNNLISVGQLVEKGIAVLFQDQECGLYHIEKGLILSSAMTINRMFVINARMMAQEPMCFKTSSEDTTHLWHCRYGHLIYSGLKTLKPGNMVRRLPQLTAPTKLCKDCITGKQQREIIPKRSN